MTTICTNCGSHNLKQFDAEANIHFPGLKGADRASVFVFPRFLICLDCGQFESTLSNRELQLLKEELSSMSSNKSGVAAA
jgi:hypothetical protein